MLLLAVSGADRPVAFEPRIRSSGLPACWGQAAVYHALAEGLAGITDTGRAFDHVGMSPRWEAAGVQEAEVCLHYPASGACCAYSYRYDKKQDLITLELAGSFQSATVRCLLPSARSAIQVNADTAALPFRLEKIENSSYACFDISRQQTIVIHLADTNK